MSSCDAHSCTEKSLKDGTRTTNSPFMASPKRASEPKSATKQRASVILKDSLQKTPHHELASSPFSRPPKCENATWGCILTGQVLYDAQLRFVHSGGAIWVSGPICHTTPTCDFVGYWRKRTGGGSDSHLDGGSTGIRDSTVRQWQVWNYPGSSSARNGTESTVVPLNWGGYTNSKNPNWSTLSVCICRNFAHLIHYN